MQQIIRLKILTSPKLLMAFMVFICAGTNTYAQTNPIKGKVVNESGIPVPGVTVAIKGTSVGTTTNDNGDFIIKPPNKDASLIISSIGYEKQELKLNERNNLRIELKKSASRLDEVQIIAYGTTTERLNTGNVSTIKAETIEQQPVSDPIATLEGRVPGLFIQQNSGLPGSGFLIRLRGQNSIANGNNPLFIIDGIPFNSASLDDPNLSLGGGVASSPFNNLNPADIEDIEVLKDADATAIYGSRGANGVVLITTKKGEAGNTKVDFNVYTGFGKITRKMDLLSTKDYLRMRHEAFNNDGATPQPSDYDINGAWDTTRYTDWQRTLIGGTAHTTSVQASVSGGNKTTQFFIGTGYHKETTVFPGSYRDQKASVHFNLTNTSANKKLRVSLSGSYTADNNFFPITDLTNFINLPPDAPSIYDSNGKLNWQNSTWTNPFSFLEQKSRSVASNLISNLEVSYHVFEGLQIKGNFGYNNIYSNQINTTPLSSYDPSYQPYLQAETDLGNNNLSTWIIEPQINYHKKLKIGTIDILVGTTFQENKQKTLAQVGLGFTSDALLEDIQAASTIIVVSSTNSAYRYNAVFGRLTYNWADKYLINLTARRDGSSRFGPANRFADFGAVGAGWIFTEEKFVRKAFPFLSFGKLRGSYGITGNDQIGDYQYLSTYSSYPYPYEGISGLYPTRLANPFYEWEINKKLEGGIELGFLGDKILFNASCYRNLSSNQLVGYALPGITGFTSITANLPATVENTGWELELTTANIKAKKFTWTSSFNLTLSGNKLLSFPNLEGSSYASRYEVGMPLQIAKVYHNTGVNPQTGQYQFEQIADKKNTSSPKYPDDLIPVSLFPKYYGGMLNTFRWGNLELNIFFQFVRQSGRNYLSNFTMPGGNGQSNQPTYILNHWSQIGDNKNIQRFSQDYGSAASNSYFNYFQNSDASISDASFIRLKNLAISYNLTSLTGKRSICQNLRLYIQGQDILTFTKYLGLDPENRGQLPPIRMLTAGIQITL